MMMMLHAGGMDVLTDHVRQADDDNPKGYYEYEPVKDIETDRAWLVLAQGRAIKMISALLIHLPAVHNYKVIFMRRKMEEIVASQRRMLIHRGEESGAASDDKITQVLEKHLTEVNKWLSKQANIDVLFVDYGKVLADPYAQASIICRFLDGSLDPQMMAAAVDRRLYRQRR